MLQVDQYLSNLGNSLEKIPLESVKKVIQVLYHAHLNGKQIFIMGNGGSASTATHFVCDLAKNNYFEGLPPFKAIDLNSSNAILTALANDEGYENIFSQQLRNLVSTNDVVIAISTSGNSPNILKAVDLANRAGAITVGFTGYEGGQLADMVNVEVRVPSNNIRHIEDIHMVISHLISFALYEMCSETVGLKVDLKETLNTNQLANSIAARMELSESSVENNGHKTSLLFQLLKIILDLTKTQNGTLILLDEHGEIIDGAQVYDGKTINPSVEQLIDISQNGLAGWVVKNQQAALVDNTTDDHRWLRRPWEIEQADSKSALSVPIKVGKVVGCITLVRPKEKRFSIKDLEIVTNMTSSIAPAILDSDEEVSL